MEGHDREQDGSGGEGGGGRRRGGRKEKRLRCESCGGMDVEVDENGFFCCGDCGQIQADMREVGRDEDDLLFEMTGKSGEGARGARVTTRNVKETTLATEKEGEGGTQKTSKDGPGGADGERGDESERESLLSSLSDDYQDGRDEESLRRNLGNILRGAQNETKFGERGGEGPAMKWDWNAKEKFPTEFDFLRGWQTMLQFVCSELTAQFGITEWISWEAKQVGRGGKRQEEKKLRCHGRPAGGGMGGRREGHSGGPAKERKQRVRGGRSIKS